MSNFGSRSANTGGTSSPSVGSQGTNAFTRKLGPLPTWGWMAVGLAIALAYYFIKQSKKGSNPNANGTDTTANPDETTASSQIPQFVIEDMAAPVYNNSTSTSSATATSTTPPTPPQPLPKPPPGHTPPPPPPHPHQKFVTVTVAKFPGKETVVNGKKLAQWNTTLWGIANHYGVPGGYEALAKLNHIKNPNIIQPGQKIQVPVK